MKSILQMTLLCLLFLGCATSKEAGIRKLEEKFFLPEDQKQDIINGFVSPGMTTDMVLVSWGKPNRITHNCPTVVLCDTVWEYSSHDLFINRHMVMKVWKHGTPLIPIN